MTALNGFARYMPRLIIPGHGDPGPICIASALALQIETVRRQVQVLVASGKTAAGIIRDDKKRFIAENPDWEHPDVLDWQISYFAAGKA